MKIEIDEEMMEAVDILLAEIRTPTHSKEDCDRYDAAKSAVVSKLLAKITAKEMEARLVS